MIAFIALMGTVFVPAVSASEPRAERPTLCERAYSARMAVVKKHGKRAPGRNICRYGVKTKRGARDATTKEKARYLRALKRLNAPWTSAPSVGPGAPRVAPAGTATPVVVGGHLASIAACESGGSPSAVSSTGQYRGKYQFSYATWQSVGGVGDPAQAPEAEQDMRAAMLYQRSGPGQWPVCQHAGR